MKLRLSVLLGFAGIMASCGSEQATQQTPATTTETQPVMTEGHKLFINNCVQCHNLKKDKIGPMLEGVMARWDNDTVRIRHFIQNSQAAISAGDKRAVAVYEKWNKALMTPMPQLTDGEIDQILEYINAGVE